MRIFGLLLSLCLTLAAPTLHAQVTVSNPWVRATVSDQKATGAFMTISAPTSATLVGAYSPVAEIVELHSMKVEDGVMRMRPVETIALPANTPVELKPGGLHIMLMGLKAPLDIGESVALTLLIREHEGRETTTEITVPVRSLDHAPGHPKR